MVVEESSLKRPIVTDDNRRMANPIRTDQIVRFNRINGEFKCNPRVQESNIAQFSD